MPSFLSLVSPPQADHTHLVASVGDDGDMEAIVDVSNYRDPSLAVIHARVVDDGGRLEIHVGEALEADSALPNVPRVLRRIELKLHNYIVYTIKMPTEG